LFATHRKQQELYLYLLFSLAHSPQKIVPQRHYWFDQGLSILRVQYVRQAACETMSETFLTFNLDIHFLIPVLR